jgi:hypothetical protein
MIANLRDELGERGNTCSTLNNLDASERIRVTAKPAVAYYVAKCFLMSPNYKKNQKTAGTNF